jgi:hypothetical protein
MSTPRSGYYKRKRYTDRPKGAHRKRAPGKRPRDVARRRRLAELAEPDG